MCEFQVFIEGRKIMEDVVFAEAHKNGVRVRDVIGESKIFENVKIVEVNVPLTRLILERV